MLVRHGAPTLKSVLNLFNVMVLDGSEEHNLIFPTLLGHPRHLNAIQF